jgi:hypothetical protein
MLRINLLPPYVALARATKKLFIGFLFLLAALVGCLMFWYITVHNQIGPMTQQADEAQAAKDKVDGINAQAAAATASIAPIQAKVDFYDGAQKYNTAYLQLYHNIFLYTSPEVLYNNLNVNGTTMTISGYTPSYSALGRYLMEMYKEPDITNLTLTSQLPANGSASPNVPQNIPLPAGIVGHLPGYNVPVTSYTVLGGKITAVNQGGAVAGGGGFGAPQFATQTPGAAGGVPFNLRKDGFPFSVVLTLKTALVAPQPPTGAPAAGAAGAPAPGAPANAV